MVTWTNYSLKWWWFSKEMPPKCPKHSDLVIRKYFAQMDPMGIYRWWLHFCCLFSSLFGENDPIWLMGWSNQRMCTNMEQKDWIGKLRSSHEMFLVNVGEYLNIPYINPTADGSEIMHHLGCPKNVGFIPVSKPFANGPCEELFPIEKWGYSSNRYVSLP